jgi:hypothetical protein
MLNVRNRRMLVVVRGQPREATMTEFADELEIFRTEEEYAQQAFFAYLSVRSLAATDKDVLANMNNTPLFWRTTHHAMLEAAFLALGAKYCPLAA